MSEKEGLKLAILHACFVHKGGGEKLIFGLRNYFKAPLFAGAINFKNYSPNSSDSFSDNLFNPEYKLTYLHKDLQKPPARLFKRLLFLLFSKKIKPINNYDAVIFSGNLLIIPRRLKKMQNNGEGGRKTKFIMYCHTPPRKLTDQFDAFVKNAPAGLRCIYKYGGRFVLRQYIKDLQQMDLIISNSLNTQKRLMDYTGLKSIVIYPAVDVNRFKFISQGDYYLSYARLDKLKRIPLILEAFEKMPDKKLVICSAGPLSGFVKEQIKKRNLSNIIFEGLVTDERLNELAGNCFAGIYIPVNEDFGITQIEIMSAGKPIIGVKEGGLLETVIDGETGVLINTPPKTEDLINAVKNLTPEKALAMKDACIAQANKFNSQIFFDKIEDELNLLLYK